MLHMQVAVSHPDVVSKTRCGGRLWERWGGLSIWHCYNCKEWSPSPSLLSVRSESRASKFVTDAYVPAWPFELAGVGGR